AEFLQEMSRPQQRTEGRISDAGCRTSISLFFSFIFASGRVFAASERPAFDHSDKRWIWADTEI
ncbi:unnamed protein product, partial [Bubo scandiacus]